MDTVVGPGVVKDHGLSVIPLSISGSLGVVTEMSGSIEKRMKQLIGVNNLIYFVEGRSLSKHKCEVLLLAGALYYGTFPWRKALYYRASFSMLTQNRRFELLYQCLFEMEQFLEGNGFIMNEENE